MRWTYHICSFRLSDRISNSAFIQVIDTWAMTIPDLNSSSYQRSKIYFEMGKSQIKSNHILAESHKKTGKIYLFD